MTQRDHGREEPADAFADRGVAYARMGDFNRAVVDFDRR